MELTEETIMFVTCENKVGNKDSKMPARIPDDRGWKILHFFDGYKYSPQITHKIKNTEVNCIVIFRE